jgi:Icc-related predicted phosphoesterase
MRFLIFGDLHGKIPKIKIKDFDAVITPGDFCTDNLKKYMFKAMKLHMQGKSNKLWYELIGKREAKKLVKKSLQQGRKVLEFLNSLGKPVYIVPGNWDWTKEPSDWKFLEEDFFKQITKGLRNIKNVHNRLLETDEFSFIGYGIRSGPELPFDGIMMLEDYQRIQKKYDKLLAKYTKLFKKAKKPVIFISHNVPFATKLDLITNKQSPRYGDHVGSVLVREICETLNPVISIAGHMHEHFGKVELNKSIAINAGYGPNKNVVLEIKKNKIKKLRFLKK